MSYINQCQNCGKEFNGYINKRFCGDTCRKQYKRHHGIPVFKMRQEDRIPEIADNCGQQEEKSRTVSPGSRNNIENFLIKKLINVGANVLQKKLTTLIDPPKATPVSNPMPLEISTAESDYALSGIAEFNKRVVLSPEFKEFLGNITFPFKMLVWGVPGYGKSTFCMKLANEIANSYNILYVSGEEKLNSTTIKDKQKRTIADQNKKACMFINRLPVSIEEWKQVLIQKSEDIYQIRHKAIFYDSVTKLDITPFYVDAVSGECKMPFFNKDVSHIFISHAHKDGSHYRGDGSWGHEVDVIIKCNLGEAVIEKNRFGEAGKAYKIF
jgi:hypothetical protein